MRIFKRIRGPRLGTKIMLLGLTLLIVPWFSYRQLVEMEQLLINGQGRTQLLTAEGISTLFNGREDLFEREAPRVEWLASGLAHGVRPSDASGDIGVLCAFGAGYTVGGQILRRI